MNQLRTASRLVLCAIIFWTPFLYACSPASDQTKLKLSEINSDAELSPKVPLWRVSDTDTEVLLLPAVNATPPGLLWMDQELRLQLSKAKYIFLLLPVFSEEQLEELDASIKKHATMENAEAFYSAQTPMSLDAIQGVVEKSGGSPEEYFGLKPLGIHDRLISWIINKERPGYAAWIYNEIFEIDRVKPIEAKGFLFPSDQYWRIIYSSDENDQYDALIKFVQNPSLFNKEHDEEIDAWLRGDTKRLAQLYFRNEHGVMQMRGSNYFDVVVALSGEISQRILTLMDNLDGTILVVLDAQYLVGDHSVIEQLKQRDIRVSRVH